ncbi:MAG: hypothetical protein V4467_04830 [Patescibacteria group bacterium]
MKKNFSLNFKKFSISKFQSLFLLLTVFFVFSSAVEAAPVSSNPVTVYVRPSVSCTVNPKSIVVGQSATWTVNTLPSAPQTYDYAWTSGDSSSSGAKNGNSYTVAYKTAGTFTASVTVTPIIPGIDPTILKQITVTKTCSGSVTVGGKPDLTPLGAEGAGPGLNHPANNGSSKYIPGVSNTINFRVDPQNIGASFVQNFKVSLQQKKHKESDNLYLSPMFPTQVSGGLLAGQTKAVTVSGNFNAETLADNPDGYDFRYCIDIPPENPGVIDEGPDGEDNNCSDYYFWAPVSGNFTVDFTAFPQSITRGGTTLLKLSSNADSCERTIGSPSFSDGPIGTGGDFATQPVTTTTYSVTCSKSGFSDETKTATVTVRPNIPAEFSASCQRTDPPSSTGAVVGLPQNITWSASVSGGTAPFTYQWRKDQSEALSAPQASNVATLNYDTSGVKYAFVTVTDSSLRPKVVSDEQCSIPLLINPTPTGDFSLIVDPIEVPMKFVGQSASSVPTHVKISAFGGFSDPVTVGGEPGKALPAFILGNQAVPLTYEFYTDKDLKISAPTRIIDKDHYTAGLYMRIKANRQILDGIYDILITGTSASVTPPDGLLHLNVEVITPIFKEI